MVVIENFKKIYGAINPIIESLGPPLKDDEELWFDFPLELDDEDNPYSKVRKVLASYPNIDIADRIDMDHPLASILA
jgi:hypothetical protein